MKESKVSIVTKAQLEARALQCETEGLDFISLKPFPEGATIGNIFHAELGREVKTLYVPA